MEKQIPKNVRQIGNVSDKPKIYVEDYVDTFLNQLCDKTEENPNGAFLIGQTTGEEGKECVYISGAIQMDEIEVVGPDVAIGENVFASAKEKRKEFFEEEDQIIGWFLIIPGNPLVVNSNIKKLHEKFFLNKNSIFIMKEPVEKDEVYFTFKNGDLVQKGGHYIYYEKNQSMQNYMLSERKRLGITPSEVVTDKAAKDFRSLIRDRMEEGDRGHTSKWTYAASTFLVLVVLIIGVTMINNYDKMKAVQSSLDQLSDALVQNEDKSAISASADGENVENQSEDQKSAAEDTDDQSAGTPGKEESASADTDSQNSETQDTKAQKTNDTASADTTAYDTYTVQDGDTLVRISLKVYGSKGYVDKICQLNNLSDGDLIYVGQKLLLP